MGEEVSCNTHHDDRDIVGRKFLATRYWMYFAIARINCVVSMYGSHKGRFGKTPFPVPLYVTCFTIIVYKKYFYRIYARTSSLLARLPYSLIRKRAYTRGVNT